MCLWVWDDLMNSMQNHANHSIIWHLLGENLLGAFIAEEMNLKQKMGMIEMIG